MTDADQQLHREIERLRKELASLREASSSELTTSTSIEGVQSLLLRLDENQCIRYINTALARYMGVERSDLVGKSSDVLKIFFDREVVDALLIQGGETTQQSTVSDSKRGRVLEVRATVKGGMLDVVMQDITNQDRYRRMISPYLPASLDNAEQLTEEEISTFRFAERRLMSVSFSDLRGFTAMSDRMSPEEVRSTVNAFLEVVIEAISRNDATLDKIVGDEVMAMYGAPRYWADHALRAVKTVCDQMEGVLQLQEEFRSMGKELPGCGIGLNTGDMVLGPIGVSRQSNYTVMGTAVNLASRLCSAARAGEILVTEGTLNAVLDNLPEGWRKLEGERQAVCLEGISGKIEGVFSLGEELEGRSLVIGESPEAPDAGEHYQFCYLYALKAKGFDQPVPVIGLKRLGSEAGQSSLRTEVAVTGQEEKIFGKYRLTEVLGRGGMGEVWRARDGFGNPVAIKILRAGEGASDVQLARFRREAEVMAKLSHRNICRIFEVGEVNGVHYIAMELLEGAPLSSILQRAREDGVISDLNTIISDISRERSSMGVEGVKVAESMVPGVDVMYQVLPFQQTIGIMIKICEAIQFAHEHGILHRDLKPANIMIRPDGEPVVMDFGLAKTDHGNEVSVSMTGQIVGTIEYMAPEQAMSAKDVDERVDVYALGAISYLMISGRKQFVSSGNMLSDAQKLQDHIPKRPRSFNKKVEEDLELITLKALRADTEQRYRSVAALKDDLERFQKGEVISAKDVTTGEILLKAVKRNKALVSAIGVAALLVGLVVVISFWMVNEERLAAIAAKVEAKQAHEDLVETMAGSDFLQGVGNLERGRADYALAYFARAVRLGKHENAATRIHFALEHHRWWLPREPRVEHEDAIAKIVLSPDRKRVATASADGTARIWDLQSLEPIGSVMRHDGAIEDVVFSPDGKRLATASWDGTARLWDVPTGGSLGKLGHREGVFQVEFSPDGKFLFTASTGGRVAVWDVSQLERRQDDLRHDDEIQWFALSEDGSELTSVSWNGVTYRWGLDGKLKWKQALGKEVIFTRLAENGNWLITGTEAGGGDLWDLRRKNPVRKTLTFNGILSGAQFDTERKIVGISSWDGTVKCWSLESGETKGSEIAHEQWVSHMVLDPKGRILTLSGDGVLHLWDGATGERQGEPMTYHEGVKAAFLIGEDVLAVGWEGDWIYWKGGKRLSESKEKPEVDVSHYQPRTVAAHAELQWREGDAIIKKKDGTSLRLEQEGIDVYAEFSPDETMVATASAHGHARLWDAHSGVPMHGPLKHSGGKNRSVRVHQVRFNHQGNLMVSVSEDKTARVWEVDTGEVACPPLVHEENVRVAEFHPNGKWIVTLSGNGTVLVWSVESGHVLMEPVVSEHRLKDLRITEDGMHFVGLDETDHRGVWRLYPEAPVETWLADLAESVGGWQLDEQGKLKAVKNPAQGMKEVRKELAKQESSRLKEAVMHLLD